MAVGNDYSQDVNDDEWDAYFAARLDRYDAVTSALNEAYDVTIVRTAPDIDDLTTIPTAGGLDGSALIEHDDGDVEVCLLSHTPATYVLTCPQPEESIE